MRKQKPDTSFNGSSKGTEMNKRKIESTKFFSHKIGTIPRGCQLCVRGEKLVMFVTGLCPRNCSYCPISDKKHQHDVTYANEWPTADINDIIEEARLTEAKGAGFTGGDPMEDWLKAENEIDKRLSQLAG